MSVKQLDEEALFHAARRITPPDARALFIQQACGHDAGLAERVVALLQMHEQEEGEAPPEKEAPALLRPTIDQEPAAERTGARVGPYRLMEQIGEGGFGLVFVAEQQEPVKRKVALKVIKPGMDSKAVIARFEAERQALALMDHPNIARVLDAGSTASGRPYFVMELVRGIPITDYCDQNQLTPNERLELFVSVCHAIQHAHQKGIIHRDIKPSNVLVTSHDGKPLAKVIDFGVAKAIHQHLTERTIYTHFAQMIGTPLYMSPEQAEMSGLDIDTRSDIYSLGVLLYELLTGSTPLEKRRFAEAAYDEIRRLIREVEPPRPSQRLSTCDTLPSVAANRKTEPDRLSRMLKGELDWVVMKALEKDRTRRYETANGLARDIQRFLADEVVEARPPSTGYRLRKFVRRNKGPVVAVSLLLLALLAGIGGTTWGLIQARDAAAAEQAARQAAEDEKTNAVRAAKAERQAKLEAEAEKTKAEAAAAAEKTARGLAQKRLTQIEKGNEIITSIFADLDIHEVREGTEPLEAVLAQRLVKAADQLEGEAVGDPQVVAGLQTRLGQSLLVLGHPQDAIPLLVKARATLTSRRGADHPDTLSSMQFLATGYRDAGKLDLALPLYEETLKLRKARLGADHPDTLTSMNNLAGGYHAAGKLDLALPLMEEAVKLSKAIHGADHRHTLFTTINLATCYHFAGKVDRALPLLEEALKLQKARMGADHPYTLSAMDSLALAYKTAGKLDLALQFWEETLKRRQARLGADHPHTLGSMNNLALVYKDIGKLDLALPLLEETLKLQKAKLGPDHPSTLITIKNLQFVRNLITAESRYRDKLAEFGPGHIDTLLARRDLAQVYIVTGRLSDAEQSFVEILAKMKDRAADDPIVDFTFGLLRRCLAIRATKEPDAWTTFNTRSLLGGALLGHKKYADAEPLLLAGYEGMKERAKTIPSPGKVCLAEAVERLVQLYEATDRKDDAARWRKELEALKAAQKKAEKQP